MPPFGSAMACRNCVKIQILFYKLYLFCLDHFLLAHAKRRGAIPKFDSPPLFFTKFFDNPTA
jgi:hypothetical protein